MPEHASSGSAFRRRLTLRTRLVVAFTLVALSVLALSYAATYALVRQSIQETALSDLRTRSSALQDAAAVLRPEVQSETTPSGRQGLRAGAKLATQMNRIRTALRLTDMRAVFLTPAGVLAQGSAGAVFSLPAPLTANDLDANALLAGREVSGRHGDTVYLAVPAGTIGAGANERQVVLVVTDTVNTDALDRAEPLLLLAGVVVLILVVLVSAWLARRLTKPIQEIERAAGELATGRLSARANVSGNVDDELAALARTLNGMAAQLEQARGAERAFLLSISHDLRTPLTSIRGYADALGRRHTRRGRRRSAPRAAAVIGAEARRLERLVRDLLDLSRLDSRQFSLSARPCDAAAIVRDAAEAFDPAARDIGIALHVDAPAPLDADLDPDRLAQIVANLVENALKYATARVEVSVQRDPAGRIDLVVTDDGEGIPEADLPRVFERLYTVRGAPGAPSGPGSASRSCASSSPPWAAPRGQRPSSTAPASS